MHIVPKNSLLAPSGAKISGGGGQNSPAMPHTTAKGLVWKGLKPLTGDHELTLQVLVGSILYQDFFDITLNVYNKDEPKIQLCK